MTSRTKKLVFLLTLLVAGTLFMTFNGIEEPWHFATTGVLVAGTAVTVFAFYAEPHSTQTDSRKNPSNS